MASNSDKEKPFGLEELIHVSSRKPPTGVERHGVMGRFALLVVAAFVVSLCAGSAAIATNSRATAKPIKVGLISDRTGTFSALGTVFDRGAQSAVSLWNADKSHRRISLQICDSQSTGEGALACYLRFRNSVDSISGPHLFVGLAATKEQQESGKTPSISLAPLVYPRGNSGLYQLIPTIPAGVLSGMKFFQAQGLTKIATITSNDQPGNLARNAVAKYAKKYGISVSTQESFDPTSQNLAPQALRVARSDPQAVLAWAVGGQVITVLRALKSAGVDQPVMMSFAAMTVPLLSAAGDAAGSNLRFFATQAFDPESIKNSAWRARVNAFTKYYTETFKLSIDLNALGIADTVIAGAQAVQLGKNGAGGIKALDSGRQFPGILYPSYSFSKRKHYGRKSNDQSYSILAYQPATKTFKVIG